MLLCYVVRWQTAAAAADGRAASRAQHVKIDSYSRADTHTQRVERCFSNGFSNGNILQKEFDMVMNHARVILFLIHLDFSISVVISGLVF